LTKEGWGGFENHLRKLKIFYQTSAMPDLNYIPYNRSNKERASKNRKNQTPAERILREKVLRRKQTGYAFLRQKMIGSFILDFYCSKLLLAIEVDGRTSQ